MQNQPKFCIHSSFLNIHLGTLRSRNLFHQTFKLYIQCIIFEIINLLLMFATNIRYATNGIGWPILKLIAQVCRFCFENFFLPLQISAIFK